jgi:hypothetical protein
VDWIEDLFQRQPLLAFSIYTQMQVQRLAAVSAEIRATLDRCIQPPGKDQQPIEADAIVEGKDTLWAYTLFWLWTLGAYEVVRTMAQAAERFSPEAGQRIKAFKDRIAELRIPFAKQEYRGRERQVIEGGELSVHGMDSDTKDLLFEVRGQTFTVRTLMAEFEELVQSISRADVLSGHLPPAIVRIGPEADREDEPETKPKTE